MAGWTTALATATGPAGGGLLDALVEALPLGVLVQDADRRVVLVNTAFLRLAGISARPAELVGVTFDGSAQHVLDLFEVAGGAEPAATGPAPAGSVPAGSAPAGSAPAGAGTPGRIVERDCLPLESAGRQLGHLWVLRDVTDQAAARRAAAEHDRLLAELAALRSDFVATVSHELRTPLTSIVGLSTLLVDGGPGLDPEQTECLQAIERSADRLLRLADDLTLLAGLESQRLPLRDEPVDLTALVGERAPAWQDTATAGGALLRLDLAAAGPPLRGDQRLLTRMLDDLVGAAVAASLPGAEISFSARPAAGHWLLELTDPNPAPGPAPGTTAAGTGRGAAAGGAAGDAGRHGAGLGPSIGRAIAKRHRGDLTVQAAAAGGSTVRIRLPATDPATPPGF